MSQVMQEAVRLLSLGEPFVLATVVRTLGSTPQSPGAQVIVRQDGTLCGTIGGGCVEGDVWQLARHMLQHNSGPELREYVLNEDIVMRDGLVCGGTMYLFLEALRGPGEVQPLLESAVHTCAGGPATVIATLVASPSRACLLGRKMMVDEHSTTRGSLGDTEFDRLVSEAAPGVLQSGSHKYLQTPQDDALFLAAFATPPTLILLGGGHVGKAVSQLAATLGFRVCVVDNRAQFASRERFPEAAATVVCEFEEWTDHLAVPANSFIVIATSGHKGDDLALAAALRTPARYIGMIGSKRKSLCICRDLLSRGLSRERLAQVHTPIGLDIGAVSPEEIAVSIMAEILMDRRGASGRPMRLDPAQLTNDSK